MHTHPLPITHAKLTMPAVEGNLFDDTPREYPIDKVRLLLHDRNRGTASLNADVGKNWAIGLGPMEREVFAVRVCLEQNFPGITFDLIPSRR